MLGRFLQTDPVIYDDDVNLYAYVRNDPTNIMDSSGMDAGGGCAPGTGNPGSRTCVPLLQSNPGGDATVGAGGFEQALTEFLGTPESRAAAFQQTIDGFQTNLRGLEAATQNAMNSPEAFVLGMILDPSPYGELRAGTRTIEVINGFVDAPGSPFKFSIIYYNRLWAEGRPAPFLAAQEVLETATSITPDLMPGFYRYSNGATEMVYNPTTREVWHLQPVRPQRGR